MLKTRMTLMLPGGRHGTSLDETFAKNAVFLPPYLYVSGIILIFAKETHNRKKKERASRTVRDASIATDMKRLFNIFSRKRRERLCLARDFVVLAWSGNGLGASELAFMKQLFVQYRLDTELLNVISQAPDAIADTYPTAVEERMKHLVRMVRFALSHGKENAKARSYCRLTARKMGLPDGSAQAVAAWLMACPDSDDRTMAHQLLQKLSSPMGKQ